MAIDAGSIYIDVRIQLDELNKSLNSANAMVNKYAQEMQRAGEEGAKLYVKGFGKGQNELNIKLNEMVSSFRAISPKMGAIGDKLANTLGSSFIGKLVPIMQTAGAVISAAAPIVAIVAAAIAGLVAVFNKVSAASNKANEEQKKYNDFIKRGANDVSAYTKSQEQNNKTTKENEEAQAALLIIWEKLIPKIGEFVTKFVPLGIAVKAVINLFKQFRNIFDDFMVMTGIISEAELNAALASKQHAAAIELVEDAEKAYNSALRENTLEVDRFGKSRKASLETQKQALETYIKELETANRMMWEGTGDTLDGAEQELLDSQRKRIAEAQKGYSDIVKELKLLNQEEEKSSKKVEETTKKAYDLLDEQSAATHRLLEQERQRAEEAYKLEKKVQESYIKLIEFERTQEIAKLKESENFQKSLSGQEKLLKDINLYYDERLRVVKGTLNVEESRLHTIESLSGRIYDNETQLLNIEVDRLQAQNEQGKNNEKILELQTQILNRERERALLELRSSDEYKDDIANRSIAEQQINDIYDKRISLMESEGSALNKIEFNVKAIKDAAISAGSEILTTIANSVTDAITSGLDREREAVEEALEENLEALEEFYEERHDIIEAARERELESGYYVDAKTEESLQQQIENAKQAGDEILRLELTRRLEELQINKKYDDQQSALEAEEAARKEALELEAARKSAQLQYKADKARWINGILMATAQAASAITAAVAQNPPPWGIPMWALAGAAAAAPIAVMAANPPEMATFAHGDVFTNSIIDKPTMFNMGLMGEAGPEAIVPLTRTSNGDLGVSTTTMDAALLSVGYEIRDAILKQVLSVYLDSDLIASSVANAMNNRGGMLQQRAMK